MSSYPQPAFRVLGLYKIHHHHIILLFFLLFLAVVVQASFDANLNYKSPSARHPILGVPASRLLFKRADNDNDSTRDEKRTPTTRIIDEDHLNFTHGVASGDPMEDSVILWTRVAPSEDNESSEIEASGLRFSDDDDGGRLGERRNIACVNYRVSEDKEFRRYVSVGRAYTSEDTDWTVKVRQVFSLNSSLRFP